MVDPKAITGNMSRSLNLQAQKTSSGKIVEDNLPPENANKLMTFFTSKGILNSYKNNVFWFDLVMGKGLLKYYFFFMTLNVREEL